MLIGLSWALVVEGKAPRRAKKSAGGGREEAMSVLASMRYVYVHGGTVEVPIWLAILVFAGWAAAIAIAAREIGRATRRGPPPLPRR